MKTTITNVHIVGPNRVYFAQKGDVVMWRTFGPRFKRTSHLGWQRVNPGMLELAGVEFGVVRSVFSTDKKVF